MVADRIPGVDRTPEFKTPDGKTKHRKIDRKEQERRLYECLNNTAEEVPVPLEPQKIEKKPDEVVPDPWWDR